MGGVPPLGYNPHPDPKTRGLVVSQNEAKTVEEIFHLYVQLGCLNKVMRETAKMGGVRPIRTRLCKDSEAVPYAAPRSRHSARAAARLSLKLSLLYRARSLLKWLQTEA